MRIFGKHLKLGCIEDRENHKRIAPLLRFFSSQSENDMISLDEHVENMKPEQKAIYYIASDSITSAKNAPFLEKILEKGLEVLYLVEPIDEVAVQSLKAYKDKIFVDISKEDLDLEVFRGKRLRKLLSCLTLMGLAPLMLKSLMLL
ncbi:PREDICTED: heat shock protein 90-6, mitochondrial-like [Camelina sativa]|uniref:Heat shock protein 90-6, mitochondrial-like n=1 Tax=Camelina sativa TaxID=90675 RepID=A0ABM0VC51_CAMSA|nr:PREDICTED: heat shock protein 90-6, mitochondrial-like [Camelina sativa]